jgi:thioredoxin-like negative regulator of GroEL
MKAALDAPIRASAAVLDRILASGHPVLAVFEAPGCAPCESLLPVLTALAREYQQRVLVLRVSDCEQGWLAARYHIAYVPTLVFWRGGAECSRIRGNPGAAAIRAHLEYLLYGAPRPDPADGPRHTLTARYGARPQASTPRALIGVGR